MAINEDVMTIISILNDEGFGVLVGDLMVEISQGRDQRELNEEALVTEKADYDAREPIAPEDQLPAAMQILHRRLVAPAKALAEAERRRHRAAYAGLQHLRYHRSYLGRMKHLTPRGG